MTMRGLGGAAALVAAVCALVPLPSPLGGAEPAEDPQAAFEAGKRFASGQGTGRDLVKAAFYLGKAVRAEHPPRGAFLLAGAVNAEMKKYDEAYTSLEKAAKTGC